MNRSLVLALVLGIGCEGDPGVDSDSSPDGDSGEEVQPGLEATPSWDQEGTLAWLHDRCLPLVEAEDSSAELILAAISDGDHDGSMDASSSGWNDAVYWNAESSSCIMCRQSGKDLTEEPTLMLQDECTDTFLGPSASTQLEGWHVDSDDFVETLLATDPADPGHLHLTVAPAHWWMRDSSPHVAKPAWPQGTSDLDPNHPLLVGAADGDCEFLVVDGRSGDVMVCDEG